MTSFERATAWLNEQLHADMKELLRLRRNLPPRRCRKLPLPSLAA